MPFPDRVADLTQLPEWAREYYVQDGADFKVNIKTVPVGEDVTGLKTALSQERQGRRDADKLLSEVRAQYDGIDPKQVKEMQERFEAIKDKHLYDDKGLQGVVDERTATFKTRITDLERMIQAKEAAIDKATRETKSQRLNMVLRDAAIAAKVEAHAIPYVVYRLGEIFNDIDGETPIARKANGDIMYGEDAITPYNPADHMKRVINEVPLIVASSSGITANGKPNTGTVTAQRITVTEARDHRKWTAAREAAMKAGIPLEVVEG